MRALLDPLLPPAGRTLHADARATAEAAGLCAVDARTALVADEDPEQDGTVLLGQGP